MNALTKQKTDGIIYWIATVISWVYKASVDALQIFSSYFKIHPTSGKYFHIQNKEIIKVYNISTIDHTDI